MPDSSSDQWPAAPRGRPGTAQDSRGLGRVLLLLAVVTALVALAAFALGAFDQSAAGGRPGDMPSSH